MISPAAALLAARLFKISRGFRDLTHPPGYPTPIIGREPHEAADRPQLHLALRAAVRRAMCANNQRQARSIKVAIHVPEYRVR